jgi:hypothetical protein
MIDIDKTKQSDIQLLDENCLHGQDIGYKLQSEFVCEMLRQDIR